MKAMMNAYYLKRIDEALGENDINVILDRIGDYYKAWKIDEAENHYYYAKTEAINIPYSRFAMCWSYHRRVIQTTTVGKLRHEFY